MRQKQVRVTVPMVAKARHWRSLDLSYTTIRILLADAYGASPCEHTLRKYLGPDGRRAEGQTTRPSNLPGRTG